MLDQFVVEELQSVLNLDSLVSSHPISVRVSDPNEINEIFDGISYSKGAYLLFSLSFFNKIFTLSMFFRNMQFYYKFSYFHLKKKVITKTYKFKILENKNSEELLFAYKKHSNYCINHFK